MHKCPRRFTFLLAVLFAALFLASGPAGVSTAARQGIHLTPNGWRTPIYGMSLVHDETGALGTSCAQVSQPQVDAARFGRRVSRALLASSPRAVVRDGTGAAFDITYSDDQGSGFNDSAQGATRRRALEAAALAWSKVIRADVVIKIDAVMKEPSDEDVQNGNTLLAMAGPADFWLIDNTAIPSSLAWQMQGRRNADAEVDIQVTVNPEVSWDYATSGVSARDKVSFVYTLIHEIAHGLGFVDSFDPEEGLLLNDPVPFIYDKFVNRRTDQIRLVMNRPPHEVKDDLISNELFFNGTNATEALQRSIRPGTMLKLYAPNPYEAGSSVSHVDQDTYADFKTGTMTPRDFGGGTDKIDILTLGVLKDLGYQLIPNAVTARLPR